MNQFIIIIIIINNFIIIIITTTTTTRTTTTIIIVAITVGPPLGGNMCSSPIRKEGAMMFHLHYTLWTTTSMHV